MTEYRVRLWAKLTQLIKSRTRDYTLLIQASDPQEAVNRACETFLDTNDRAKVYAEAVGDDGELYTHGNPKLKKTGVLVTAG